MSIVWMVAVGVTVAGAFVVSVAVGALVDESARLVRTIRSVAAMQPLLADVRRAERELAGTAARLRERDRRP